MTTSGRETAPSPITAASAALGCLPVAAVVLRGALAALTAGVFFAAVFLAGAALAAAFFAGAPLAGAPAAVVISPTEFKALGKPIDEAAKAVPIIGIDSGADSKAFTSFLTTDNVQGGRIAADGLAAAIKAATGKEEGEVAIITSLPGVGSLDQRREGFLDQMKTKYPGIKVTVDRFADGQATTGLNMMTDLITANPNIVGVFASNLIMAQGVGQAIAENKLGDKIKVIGFDSDEKTVGFLKEGVLAGLVVQDPYRMGYDGVKTALAVSKGEKVETFVDTGANLVTQANMADPKIDALLNPKVN